MIDAKVWLGALAVSALAVGCGSSGKNGGTEGAAGTSGSSGAAGGQTMILTGCVQEGMPAGTYVLKTSTDEGTAGTSGTGKEGAQSSSSQAAGGHDERGATIVSRTYRLIATGNLDLGQNLGKEVSVTGQPATQAQDNTGAAGTSGSANDDRTARRDTRGEGASDQVASQFFRVTSMSKLADQCSSGHSQEPR